MVQRIAWAAAFAVALTASLLAQVESTAESLTFEVASIKPTKERLPLPIWRGGARQTSVTGITPLMLLRGAFNQHVNNSGSGWNLHADRYAC